VVPKRGQLEPELADGANLDQPLDCVINGGARRRIEEALEQTLGG